MTLSVNDGTLYLGTSAGLAGSSGNGSSSINLSGKLAALDAALDGLEYFPTAGFFGIDYLSLLLDDSAGQQTASNSQELSISQEVPQPTFSLGSDQSIPTGVGAQTISGWASGMTAGLPDGSGDGKRDRSDIDNLGKPPRQFATLTPRRCCRDGRVCEGDRWADRPTPSPSVWRFVAATAAP